MRQFQTYLLYDTADCTAPTPPPFMSGRDGWRSTCLLRETTSLLREGQKRVGTPERLAVLQLASSWEKRRLGRQQQVLSDIARRCREQEVTDLSSRITAKGQGRDGETKKTQKGGVSSLSGSHRNMAATRSNGQISDTSPSDENPCNIDIIDKKLENSYKFFPARKIIRLPGRLRLHQDGSMSQRSLPAMCVTSFHGARFSGRRTTRSFPFLAHTSMLAQSDPGLHRSETIHMDRLDSLFCSVRVALSERQKSFRCKEHVTRVTSLYDQERERMASSTPVKSFTVSIRVPASAGVAQDG